MSKYFKVIKHIALDRSLTPELAERLIIAAKDAPKEDNGWRTTENGKHYHVNSKGEVDKGPNAMKGSNVNKPSTWSSGSAAAHKEATKGGTATKAPKRATAHERLKNITKPSDLKGRTITLKSPNGAHTTVIRESKTNPNEFEVEYHSYNSSRFVPGSMNMGSFKNELMMADPKQTKISRKEAIGEKTSEAPKEEKQAEMKPKINGKMTQRFEKRWKEAQKSDVDASDVVKNYTQEINKEKDRMRKSGNAFVRQTCQQTIEQLEKEKKQIEKDFIDGDLSSSSKSSEPKATESTKAKTSKEKRDFESEINDKNTHLTKSEREAEVPNVEKKVKDMPEGSEMTLHFERGVRYDAKKNADGTWTYQNPQLYGTEETISNKDLAEIMMDTNFVHRGCLGVSVRNDGSKSDRKFDAQSDANRMTEIIPKDGLYGKEKNIAEGADILDSVPVGEYVTVEVRKPDGSRKANHQFKKTAEGTWQDANSIRKDNYSSKEAMEKMSETLSYFTRGNENTYKVMFGQENTYGRTK